LSIVYAETVFIISQFIFFKKKLQQISLSMHAYSLV
jgi:hypothetical protein